MKILIVDDEPTIVELLMTLLELEGFSPAVLKDINLSSIISSVRSDPPDFVLIDVNLKGVSGLDMAKAIRMDAALAKPKIIMWSGMPLEKECMAAGADSFLMKPFNPDELLTLIRRS